MLIRKTSADWYIGGVNWAGSIRQPQLRRIQSIKRPLHSPTIIPRDAASMMEQHKPDGPSDHDESYGEQLYKYTFDEGRQEPRFLIFRGF